MKKCCEKIIFDPKVINWCKHPQDQTCDSCLRRCKRLAKYPQEDQRWCTAHSPIEIEKTDRRKCFAKPCQRRFQYIDDTKDKVRYSCDLHADKSFRLINFHPCTRCEELGVSTNSTHYMINKVHDGFMSEEMPTRCYNHRAGKMLMKPNTRTVGPASRR